MPHSNGRSLPLPTAMWVDSVEFGFEKNDRNSINVRTSSLEPQVPLLTVRRISYCTAVPLLTEVTCWLGHG